MMNVAIAWASESSQPESSHPFLEEILDEPAERDRFHRLLGMLTPSGKASMIADVAGAPTRAVAHEAFRRWLVSAVFAGRASDRADAGDDEPLSSTDVLRLLGT